MIKLDHKKRDLILCPNCLLKGKKNYLAEVNNGTVIIQRYHEHLTIVTGVNMTVYCGECGEPVYIQSTTKDYNLNLGGSICPNEYTP